MITTELSTSHVPELYQAEPWQYFIKTNNDHGSRVYSLFKTDQNLKLVFVRVICEEQANQIIKFNNQ